MKNNFDINQLPPERWARIFALLSLDCVQPFYQDMGLRISDEAAFLRGLRKEIEFVRTAFESNPEEPIFIAHRVFFLPGTCSDRDKDLLYHWCLNRYYEIPSENPFLTAWNAIFARCAGNTAWHHRLSLPPHRQSTIYREYLRMVDTEDVAQRIQHLQRAPLSDWDLDTCTIHGFDPDDFDDLPFGVVVEIVEMERFIVFLLDLASTLNSDEIIHLHRSAVSVADAMGLWLPGELTPFVQDLMK